MPSSIMDRPKLRNDGVAVILCRLDRHLCCMLPQDQVGLIVDSVGTPTGSALTFLAMPVALAAAGIYVVAAAEDGLAVFDRLSGECVQQLAYGEDVVAAPGQQVLTADDAGGSCIAVAGRRVVRTIALQLDSISGVVWDGT